MTGPVGIVLVSHSGDLARGLRDLVEQLGGGEVPVAAAGGMDDGGLGTSYDLVAAGLDAVDRGAGVVVLADLGSAVLTARQLVADRARDDVVIVDAPFVEGAVAAVVAASLPGDLAAVAAAAEGARLVPKF
jgi:PTS hybrid protein